LNGRDAQLPADVPAQRSQVVFQRRDGRERLTRARRHDFPSVGQAQRAARFALQEPLAQLVLKPRQRVRERGLGGVDPPGSQRHALGFDDGQEVLQIA